MQKTDTESHKHSKAHWAGQANWARPGRAYRTREVIRLLHSVFCACATATPRRITITLLMCMFVCVFVYVLL